MNHRIPIRAAFLVLLALSLISMVGATARAPALQTPEPTVFQRPLLTLISYSISSSGVTPGETTTLEFRVANQGGAKARNIVFTFVPGDLLPSGSGGVVSGGVIAPAADTAYSQGLYATAAIADKGIATVQIQTSYTDDLGNAYSETFNLSLPVRKKSSSSGGVRPTLTPTPSPRPILLVDEYDVDVEPLKPGSQFQLSIRLLNQGGSKAVGVTMVIGGGTATGPSGTPGAEGSVGVSGAGGGLENFAPIGESNLAYLGDLEPGVALASNHALIVNSTTQPGAYPLKISLIYSDKGEQLYTDDQVITLLVFSPPLLEVGFYQPPDPFFVSSPGNLPIQVLNLDRKAVVLSRIRVESEGAELSNNELPIGYLDTGISFTIDAVAIPFAEGPLPIGVTIEYIDDFSTPRVIQETLSVEVLPLEQGLDTGGGGGGGGREFDEPLPAQPETLWTRILRFLRGLLGLDSAPTESAPLEGPPMEEPGPIVPGAPGTKG